MGIAEIKAAGENAALLAQAVLNMNSIHNEHKPQYDELLTNIQAVYPGKTMGTLTDAEINSFFFNGLGDPETILEAKTVLTQWENALAGLGACVALLPDNNL